MFSNSLIKIDLQLTKCRRFEHCMNAKLLKR